MNTQQKVLSPKVVIQLLFFIVVVPFLPLLISRRWDWWEAWTYGLISIVSFAVSRALAARRHPGLLAERARLTHHENAESWDRLLAPLVGAGWGLIPVVAGLEALLGRVATFSLPVKLLALIMMLAGHALGSYALVANPFFSGMVRIQSDRGHRIVSSGPYRWMRHPGYAGALVTYWSTPLFLDSVWAYLPVALMTVALVIRTALEDRALQGKLEGYRDYAEQVRYRLLPRVW
jgi:protein-S-isoprenylcysteine O-methyltransferase Ste14